MAAIIQSIVGNGERGYSGDGGPAKNATMDNPFHVDIDPTGKYLYIADCFNFIFEHISLQIQVSLQRPLLDQTLIINKTWE